MSGFRCQFRKGSLMKGSIPEIVQYGPSSRFECFTASKVLSTDTHLDNLINHSCECILFDLVCTLELGTTKNNVPRYITVFSQVPWYVSRCTRSYI